MTKLIVIDSPKDKVKFVTKEKTVQLWRLLNASRLKEVSDAKINPESLVNKIYSLSLDFLEKQPNLLQNSDSLKIFDRLFVLKPCCSFKLRQRTYKVFEKFCGASLKAKLMYFF